MGFLRRSAELGLGALLLTKETAELLVRDLLGEDDGSAEKEGADSRLRTKAEALRAEFSTMVREDLDRALAAAGVVRRSEFDRLAVRVAALEARSGARQIEPAVAFEPTGDF